MSFGKRLNGVRSLYKNIIGVLTVNTIIIILSIGVIVLSIVCLPRVLPSKKIKKFITGIANGIGDIVVWAMKISLIPLHRPNWMIEFPEGISKKSWYLGTSNHMSWADIFVLLFSANYKAPLLKFFMKKQLRWIPLIYLVHKTIDMPFVNRHSREEITKNPNLKIIDFENSRIAAKRFTRHPATAFSFAEGTRFSDSKKAAMKSDYKNLLNPKIGALATALAGMPMVSELIDFTLIYETDKRSAWAFACGEMKNVKIIVKKYQIPIELINHHDKSSNDYRELFKVFVDDIWKKKQVIIDQNSSF